ncbi:hypothetical protein Q2V57_09120 [Enterobacter bugandensis]|uniref:AcrVA2 family anti-CRISPR protein n=1 Tax=Enterobacter bugandensis TaxID=881260 RepID=UPI0026651554|nr:hypothetical protein [Enterobacter bugandensis]MDO2431725.1 hypothetical protein [Enterobacter bugandensis]MDO2444815.1 hypothetical protein [Enterobacter bugandensis]
MKNQAFDPICISDSFCKKYPEAVAQIEQTLLMKGRELPGWPYWCFLPVTCWMMLFMGKQHRTFTMEMWQEIQKLSVLGTWRYSKGIYTPHPSLLRALTETPVSDSLPVDVFLRLPEWCIYVKTPGMFIEDERLHGFWATVSKNIHEKILNLLLNGQQGIRMESFPIKSGSINAILEDIFHKGLESCGAATLQVESVKKLDYISTYLQRKARNISKLLSILLYICSDEPEIDSERQPGTFPTHPKPVKTKKGFRLFPATGPRYWTVGEKTGQLLDGTEVYDETETTSITGRHVRAHLRRGHWHGFWSGKKNTPEERKFSYHWLPPQIIGGRR